MQNLVFYSVKNENIRDSVQFSGMEMSIRDFRMKVKERLNWNTDDFCILDQSQRVLTMADRLQNAWHVQIQRMGYCNSLCRSCFSQNSTYNTPCCKQPICGGCDSKFSQTMRCPFVLNTSCQDYYRSQANPQDQPEISVQELDKIIKDAAFFIVKSNNELNVSIAKSYNIWATTQKNFKRLIQAFNQNQQVVILIFTANRAEKFLGCARMKNIYENTPKQWQGASNILLADNFGIEWLRKGKLDFQALQEMPNPLTGESVTKSRDCQEVPKDIGRTICMGFEQIKPEEQFHEFQQSSFNHYKPQFEPIDSPPNLDEQYQQQQQQNNDEEDEWDYDEILGKGIFIIYIIFLERQKQLIQQQPSQQQIVQKQLPQPPPPQAHASPVPVQSGGNKQSSRSNSSKSSKSSDRKNQQQQELVEQEKMFQQMMIMQSMQPQLMMQMAMQQQMEKWNNINKGKIPGLTGKIQYAHPYLVTMMQKMNQNAQDPVSDDDKRQSKRRRSRSKSHHKKSKKDKDHKKKRSRSRDRKKSHRKH